MHEILTLQLGHRANHLCTHFWNVQESYFTYPTSPPTGGAHDAFEQQQHNNDISPVDHDIHWRAGIGPVGEDTYTPRSLIYDLKGGFGGMRVGGWEEAANGGQDSRAVGAGSGNGNGVW